MSNDKCFNNISLAGAWSVALDDENIGEKENWFNRLLDDRIQLPGSLDENGFGEKTDCVDTYRLNRVQKFVGIAWYNRIIDVDEEMVGKHITLFLERCMWKTQLWVNGNYVGSCDSLSTPHIYCLDQLLIEGDNLISIKVDNTPIYNMGLMSHGYSEEIQTIWNGITGRIELQITDLVHISNLQVYPDVFHNSVKVKCEISDSSGKAQTGKLLLIAKNNCGMEVGYTTVPFVSDGKDIKTMEVDLELKGDAELWDEFHPSLYKLEAQIMCCDSQRLYENSREITFGMRSFTTKGGTFLLNGNTIFLRGTHDAGNFPLTGYPSCSVEDWRRIYSIGKQYGINHFRFHSWCPPEAGFIAADEEGIILQAELPLFGYTAPAIGEDKERDDFLERELSRILKAYGNHPSFCLMCMGNELRGDYEILSQWVEFGKQKDSRHLYTAAANNASQPSVGIKPNKGDEFYVAHEAILGDDRTVRRCEHLFNGERPETVSDYRETLENIPIPTVSHEVGQWEIYPDYNEISKYTGVLRAKNYDAFEKSMQDNNIRHKAGDFVSASGKLSVLLYREEIERSMRTPNYGGFQLLDMHDYPGQGTATVGWLDSFWDSKGLVSSEEFKKWCDHTVILARMEKRVWLSNEVLRASIDLANYSPIDYSPVKLQWRLLDEEGKQYSFGILKSDMALQGKLSTIGTITADLSFIKTAEKLLLEISLEDTKISNSWELWVYPSVVDETIPEDIYVADSWNEEVEQKLIQGKNVLLLTNGVCSEEAMQFAPPFWNTQMFFNQRKTMGILCEPENPLFCCFPTDFHTNWQWWELLASSKCLFMTELPKELEPMVWAIDHPLRNAKLGVIYEAAIHKGKLLVCSLDLSNDLDKRPVARQLRNSIVKYMCSDKFSPVVSTDACIMQKLLGKKPDSVLKNFVKSIKANNEKWSNKIENIIDGRSDTLWISDGEKYPYVIDIELKEEMGIRGFKFLPRQDGMKEGLINSYEVYISKDLMERGLPVASGSFENNIDEKVVLFDWMDDGFNKTRSKTGRYLRFVILSGFHGDHNASIASLDIIGV